MIFCIGEILADMIGTKRGRSIRFECFAGGAPFNVACGIAKLGGNVAFAGCVGDDEIGSFLKNYAAGVANLKSVISTDPTRNTTIAFVTLNEEGERSFSFFRKNTADYALSLPMAEKLWEEADIIHLGSLMLSEEQGRCFADEVFHKAKTCGKKISFDVNYREDIFDNEETAKHIYTEWLSRADILKLSEDEATMFFGENIDESLKRLSAQRIVFVTLGKAGAAMYADGEKTSRPTADVKVVDTNGAGDAFYAGVLYQIEKGEKCPETILDFANVCGALTTSKHGATEALPSMNEVEKLFRS